MDEPLKLTAADGVVLDARWRPVEGDAGVAVLCHPHPDYGGSMQVPVVTAWADSLAGRGIASLRFDFRRRGTDEERRADVAAAVAGALDRTGGARVALVGWSYGADQALAAALGSDGRVAGVVAVAPTLRFLPAELLEAAGEGVPVVALVPEHDQFGSPERVAELLPRARAVPLAGADHFLAGHERVVADAVAEAVSELLG